MFTLTGFRINHSLHAIFLLSKFVEKQFAMLFFGLFAVKFGLQFETSIANKLFCANGGTPFNEHYCECPMPYYGLDCSFTPCINGMKLLSNSQCGCLPGYTGTFCNLPIFDFEFCWNGGTRINDNQQLCQCDDQRFIGVLCEDLQTQRRFAFFFTFQSHEPDFVLFLKNV